MYFAWYDIQNHETSNEKKQRIIREVNG